MRLSVLRKWLAPEREVQTGESAALRKVFCASENAVAFLPDRRRGASFAEAELA